MKSDEFRDILAPRRTTSNWFWASKVWLPQSVYLVGTRNWNVIEYAEMSYSFMERIQELCSEQNQDVNLYLDEARKMLLEIGYKKSERLLRWLAFFTAKYLQRYYNKILVNKSKFLQETSEMGYNPVLYLPTHKSYMDFVLMSYVCFDCGLDIPRIAAGMDFHGMVLIGRILRKACAFFLRRTFTGDKLYSLTFSEYVESLITNGDAPVEFFIEGTRSRTEKSLVPKYGFLTMALKPFVLGKIPDVTLLPVGITYDRVSEEVLLVYELLGVPKPKESTRGLLKALQSPKTNYGNIYVNFGDPVSAKEFFGKDIDRSIHNCGAVDLQNTTPKEREEIKRLAHAMSRRMQDLSIITCFNLISTVMNHRIMDFQTPLSLDDLTSDVVWAADIFERLGAKSWFALDRSDVAKSVPTNLELHKNFVKVADGKVKLLRIHFSNGTIDRSIMKGYPLSDQALDVTVPLLLLQYYSNPCAHWIVNLAFIVLVVEAGGNEVSIDTLSHHFKFLRSIYSNEFVFHPDTETKDFESAFEFAKSEKAIDQFESYVRSSGNKKLRQFCISFFRTFILSYLMMIDVLKKVSESEITTKSVQMAYQEAVESSILLGSNIHPASLSLDLVENALQSFARIGCLGKIIRENRLMYSIHREQLEEVSSFLSKFNVFYKDIEVSGHFEISLTAKL